MNIETDTARASVIELFHAVQRAFPMLSMDLNDHPENVDLHLTVPVQPGVSFAIYAFLDSDELHISAGAFQMEWFPHSKPDTREAFRQALLGLLGGEYRIREHYIRSQVYKAELQRPRGDGWQTIGVWLRGWYGALPLPRTRRVLQNIKPS